MRISDLASAVRLPTCDSSIELVSPPAKSHVVEYSSKTLKDGPSDLLARAEITSAAFSLKKYEIN